MSRTLRLIQKFMNPRSIVICLLLLCSSAYAQFPPGMGKGNLQQMNIGHFYGKIIDGTTGKPIEAASVQLIQNKYDSISKTKKDIVVNGQLTKANGDFSLEGLPIMQTYKLKISAIGYKPIEKKVAFTLSMNGGDMSQMLNNIDKDLGNIKLETTSKELGEVVVTGERPTLQLGVDRKVFNVDKNIVSQGGTAVDVMRNVPTVSVDVDGNVTLRNNAPQIFVDGRPSILTLEQIPADAIQSVELITNPSAKFDASGGQSAIINIVLKKNRRAGFSGNLRANLDMRARIGGGGDINIRQGKINFFANANINQRKSIAFGETDRRNQFETNENTLFTRNRNTNEGAFQFARTGVDWFLDNRNTITVSGSIVKGNFNNLDENSLRYDTISPFSKTTSENRNTKSENLFRNIGGMVSYKHNFAKPGKELTADINYNQAKSQNDQDINYTMFDAFNSPLNNTNQFIDAGGGSRLLVAQADYVHPVTENNKWEAGIRSQTRWFNSFQENYLNSIFISGFSNKFEYTDRIYAAYVTYSEKIKKYNFNYQLGLRAESSSYNGKQITRSQTYSNQFPLALFPSVFVTKNLKKKQDLQINYSRRINRPGFFQLMPNTDFSDVFNFTTGNPNLLPEFTHSVEISYQKTYGKKNNSLLINLFGKNTNNLIARYQSFKLIGDKPDPLLVTSWINTSNSYAAGLELVFKNTLNKWWETNYNLNIYYSKINGSNEVPGLENERTSYFIKLNNTFRLGNGWTAQLSGDYFSKMILPVSTGSGGQGGGRMGGFTGGGGFGGSQLSTTQGYIDFNYYVDLGVRKEIKLKTNALIVSVNWSDVLSSRRNNIYAVSPYFDQFSWRRRDPAFVRLNVNYRFGKMDVSLFKRKNTKGEMEMMNNGMQMQ